jgi:hypothetical protein
MFLLGCPREYSVLYFKFLNSKRDILFCSYLVVLAQELGIAVLAVVERPEGKNTILKS